MSVLAVGLLSMAQVLSASLVAMARAPIDIVARQKAVEAIESVYTARDTRVLTWAQIETCRAGRAPTAACSSTAHSASGNPGRTD